MSIPKSPSLHVLLEEDTGFPVILAKKLLQNPADTKEINKINTKEVKNKILTPL